MVACWTWSAGYEVAESGADLDLVIEFLITSLTQVFLLMFFFQGTNDIYFYNLNFNPVLNIMLHAKTDLLEHLKITFSIIVW